MDSPLKEFLLSHCLHGVDIIIYSVYYEIIVLNISIAMGMHKNEWLLYAAS